MERHSISSATRSGRKCFSLWVDAFNPAEYGPQKSQRMASFLLYLSDVSEGEETTFPIEVATITRTVLYWLKGKATRRGWTCYFIRWFLIGTIHPSSLHGSDPVIKGQKWVATKWIRDQELDDHEV
ncbi:hypothetical protein L6164_027877 [Bauhinia variegata]|uniref:Uncharacterized protein n=1 Tax=Bauhinia variegata TaxID=167791 RepID=A0ACB9LVF0_BAUVA|nr:hypothetical protein L6164_027877 [Bauhinia variegata]